MASLKTTVKKALKSGKLLVKCIGSYSDDYNYDVVNNFGIDSNFKTVKSGYFSDFVLNACSYIQSGEIINMIAPGACETFELKIAA